MILQSATPFWLVWKQWGARHLRTVAVYTLLLLFSSLFLIPFLWTVSTSLKTDQQTYNAEIQWIPDPVAWSNFRTAVQSIPFFTYLINTVLVAMLCIVGVSFSASLTAFSFGCLEWPGRDHLFVLLLASMMLPPQVVLIPQFILFCELGWVDSLKPLIVPAFFGGGAFAIFLLRQFFLTIPKSLFEAARMDGCSSFGIYWRISLPLSRPAMMTVAILTLNGVWNDFLGPLIYLNTDSNKTLALGLQAFTAQTGAQWNLLMAASLLMIFPLLLVFLVGQRYFIEGITLTGIKG